MRILRTTLESFLNMAMLRPIPVSRFPWKLIYINMKRLKDLLLENTRHRITEQRVDTVSIEDALSQQEAAFKALQMDLSSTNYMGLSDEAKMILKNNAEILADAYLEYIDNTRATIREYATSEATDYDIVNENATTLAERIETGLTY